jgi:hypothetical protein
MEFEKQFGETVKIPVKALIYFGFRRFTFVTGLRCHHVFLSVPLITFKQSIDFHETSYEHHQSKENPIFYH